MEKIKNIFLDKIDSTQTYAKKFYKNFNKKEITCIFAKKQTKGKGRFQRKWYSFTGNINATFYFYMKSKNIHLIPLILAYSFLEVLKNKNIKTKIKWPNDIFLNSKKIAGILCEVSSQNIFLGIGINVNTSKKDLAKLNLNATSIKIETKKSFKLKSLLFSLQDQFLKNLNIFTKKGFSPFYKKISANLYIPKKDIVFLSNNKKFKGKILGLTKLAGLKIKLDNKTIKTFFSGEISIVK